MAKKSYPPLTDTEYKERFGIGSSEKKEIEKDEKKKRLKKAFKKAWEVRNFEIDKFWQRSIYFWGFIAIIFTGYIYCITSESSCIVKAMYFDLYMILLGGIFSVAWLLVICGSIRWQNNWEAHIDEMEDEITGPLYKIVYCKRKKNYYSVSKISKTLAIVVIVVWCFLLIRYFFDNCTMFRNMLAYSPQFEFLFFVFLPVLATIVCVIILRIGCKTANGKINANKADFQGKSGVFLERVSGE
jgi:hypothetical protein